MVVVSGGAGEAGTRTDRGAGTIRFIAGLAAVAAVAGLLVLNGCAQTKTSLGEEQPRLSRSEVRSLLLGNTEVGVLRRPSRPAVEGYSGQTYKAYYQDNNTVWYKLDVADEFKRWDWGILETGVVCRGPEMMGGWCRAITPDGAGGYKAIGFRTGNFRYQFRVEKGLFGLPEHLLKP